MCERVFLVGFMASGKTTVGRLLAERLSFAFADTDDLVEVRAGRSIESIFSESGEGAFRRLEWEALQELGRVERSVVATGGGLFLGYAQRRFMIERGITVWLDTTLDVVRRRIETERRTSSRGRPLWAPDDPTALAALFERRRATYALAACRVDAGGSPEAVAADTARVLES